MSNNADHQIVSASTKPGEHDFARFVRIVGRGPKLSRSLSADEAYEAMAMVLADAVEPEQLGALLGVLRYRKETPEELAGFVRAARETFVGIDGLSCDLDWPSYADRHKQLPYFLLAAKLLGAAGVRVVIHGLEGEGTGTTRAVLAALGVTPDTSAAEADRSLATRGLAYLAVEAMAPALAKLFALRPRLGVRTAVNTFARALNPLAAPTQMIGVFHPNYSDTHMRTARLLGQSRAAIFKGGGGEAQRNPEKACDVLTLVDNDAATIRWPSLVDGERYPWREETLSPQRVADLWGGEIADAALVAAVTGTAAIALKLVGKATTIDQAQALAAELWRDRSV
jgi:anthranilate phosphoribosyltransferase